MKKIYNTLKQTKLAVIAALISLTTFVISCEIPENPEDILELRIDTNIFTHKGFIVVADATNQANLAGNVLSAKVTGQDADKIVTEGGEIKTTWNLTDGLAGFAVNPKFRGFSSPLSFDLEISGNGYLTKSISVVIRPEDSLTDIREVMLNVGSVPAGVATANKTATLSGGSNTNPVMVTTNMSSTSTTAQVTVPAGNTFKDVNGNTISGGSLSAQVVYFDGESGDAARSTNNQNVKTIKDKDGNTVSNANFSAVATADINMQIGTTEVKEFASPIDVCLDINSDYINPTTGAKVKAGDKFNIYATSDASGNWEFEKEGTVIDNNGKLKVVFTTNHLSTFTLGNIVVLCDEKVAFIPLPNNGVGFGSVYFGSFIKDDGSSIGYTVASKITKAGVVGLGLVNVPSQQAKLSLTTPLGSNVETPLLDWCGSISLDPTALSSLALSGETVDVSLSAKCGDNAAIRPSGVKLYIEYDAGSDTFVEVGVVQDGRISIPGITLGREYKLRVYYNGDSGDGTYTFDTKNLVIENYELPGDICDEIGL